MRYGNVCVIKYTIFILKLCLINILTISHRISRPPPRLTLFPLMAWTPTCLEDGYRSVATYMWGPRAPPAGVKGDRGRLGAAGGKVVFVL